MSIYQAVYKILDNAKLLESAKPFARKALIASRNISGKDRSTIKHYFDSQNLRKLHIGAGFYQMDGWLNSDYNPKPGVIVLDAENRFPFGDGLFDYIYCEHMIEHIGLSSASRMMRECSRVLKPGGIVRIVTPNVRSILALYQDPTNPLHDQYLKWTTDEMHRMGNGEDAPASDAIYVLNYFVRAWGHKFIYDRDALHDLFVSAGLNNVTLETVNSSRHSELRNLEHLDRLPPGFYGFESLVMEAKKNG